MSKHPERTHRQKILLQAGLTLAIILIAALITTWLIKTPPKAKTQRHTTVTPQVEVVTAKTGEGELRLHAMGTVIADQSITLTPRVSGQVQKVNSHFTPGGFFKKDEVILTIDPEDYRLTLIRLRGTVAEARAALDLEMGNQRVAEKEYELLDREVNSREKDLILRKPQLDAARAALTATRAELKMAQRDLADTKVRAPFNAVVISKAVDRGSRIAIGTTLATLAGTDAFLLRITVPEKQLKWISDTPGSASPVLISSGADTHSGVVTHIASSLEETSRMAVVYAQVEDPLCLRAKNRQKQPLRLGSFVQVEIAGPVLHDMVVLNRTMLHENNTVRILGENKQMIIRTVTIAAREGDTLYISEGLKPGDQLITSSFSSPRAEIAPTADVQPAGQTPEQSSQPAPGPEKNL
ncbi:efflux RND transporter periplasmic adaptor subunit [Desulforhopalus vacuolatus]|uniref:efflux RND transporter periplasmic adaptor subunit n=1 Tax=Desulforhopalus vacuolatus TaxID=40414 RepID=UPI001965BB96|nr:efflux RND transporter periplasmic adaptor subunit [Desulforhopalus vacuolatus]MBM9518447.1 efflux RND transporter periplasmic adaptor subunit [Desulforhopalus vacuolatus]